MYAIIETGGNQYWIEEGDVIEVELLSGEETTVNFDQILFFSDGEKGTVGTPHLRKCEVKGEILGETKGPKVTSFKYKRRKNYHRKVGHRQKRAQVKIVSIRQS